MLEATMEETQQAFNTQEDKGLVVRFSKKSHHDDAKSREAGRPVYSMVDYIEIWTPGDKANSISRPVREEDKLRFADRWRQYAANAEQIIGTPLDTWTQVTQAQVEELKYFNIHTIEQLAAVSDANAQRFLGINTLRDKAKSHLKLLAEEAPLATLQAELAQRDEIIATQTTQIKALQEAVEALKRRVE